MKKNVFEWIAFVFLFIWQLPQNLVALFMLLWFIIAGDLKLIKRNKYSFVYSSKYMGGGISLGSFAILDKYLSDSQTSLRHEEGHMWDSKLFGPLYLFVIGIPSILNAGLKFTRCYYDFYPEKLANKHGGLDVNEDCRTYIKENGEPK